MIIIELPENDHYTSSITDLARACPMFIDPETGWHGSCTAKENTEESCHSWCCPIARELDETDDEFDGSEGVVMVYAEFKN